MYFLNLGVKALISCRTIYFFEMSLGLITVHFDMIATKNHLAN